MADYPCDNHHARYHGPSNRAYLNLFREENEIRLKTSVCGDCLADLVSGWLSIALVETPEGHWDPLDGDPDLDGLWKPSGGPRDRLNGLRRR